MSLKRQQKDPDLPPVTEKRPRSGAQNVDPNDATRMNTTLLDKEQLDFYKLENDSLVARLKVLEKDSEELRELRNRDDDRQDLQHKLDKANLQRSILQDQLRALEEKTKAQLSVQKPQERPSSSCDKFLRILDGKTHDEWAGMVSDIRRLTEENVQGKADLSKEQKLHLQTAEKLAAMTGRWKTLRGRLISCHLPLTDLIQSLQNTPDDVIADSLPQVSVDTESMSTEPSPDTNSESQADSLQSNPVAVQLGESPTEIGNHTEHDISKTNQAKTTDVVTENVPIRNHVRPKQIRLYGGIGQRLSSTAISSEKKTQTPVEEHEAQKTPEMNESVTGAAVVLDDSASKKEGPQSKSPSPLVSLRKSGTKSNKKKEPNEPWEPVGPKDPALDNDFMMQCDSCRLWFHGMCAFITETQLNAFSWWTCMNCTTKSGMEPENRTNNHRHDYYDPHPRKRTQCGTERFLEELQARKFAPVDKMVRTKKGHEIDLEWMQKDGFTQPILCPDRAGLDLIIPNHGFSYDDVVTLIGKKTTATAFDVVAQEDGMPVMLKTYLRYLSTPAERRHVVLDVASLEFSKTKLSKKVQAPRIVKELSWSERFLTGATSDEPLVQKYVHMSPENSYLDFDIQMGGSSIWYHVFKGKKTFFLIEPTAENLAKYEEWTEDEKHNSERFLGDEAVCYRLDVVQGNTLLIPSGWIYAVHTPEDSLAFSGNFLHSLAVPTQLRIMDMEDKFNFLDQYCSPHFYTLCWFALDEMAGQLESSFEKGLEPPYWPRNNAVPLYVRLKHRKEAACDVEVQRIRKAEIPMNLADGEDLLRKMDHFVKRLAKLKESAAAVL